jgi:hypothetical protein
MPIEFVIVSCGRLAFGFATVFPEVGGASARLHPTAANDSNPATIQTERIFVPRQSRK